MSHPAPSTTASDRLPRTQQRAVAVPSASWSRTPKPILTAIQCEALKQLEESVAQVQVAQATHLASRKHFNAKDDELETLESEQGDLEERLKKIKKRLAELSTRLPALTREHDLACRAERSAFANRKTKIIAKDNHMKACERLGLHGYLEAYEARVIAHHEQERVRLGLPQL